MDSTDINNNDYDLLDYIIYSIIIGLIIFLVYKFFIKDNKKNNKKNVNSFDANRNNIQNINEINNFGRNNFSDIQNFNNSYYDISKIQKDHLNNNKYNFYHPKDFREYNGINNINYNEKKDDGFGWNKNNYNNKLNYNINNKKNNISNFIEINDYNLIKSKNLIKKDDYLGERYKSKNLNKKRNRDYINNDSNSQQNNIKQKRFINNDNIIRNTNIKMDFISQEDNNNFIENNINNSKNNINNDFFSNKNNISNTNNYIKNDNINTKTSVIKNSISQEYNNNNFNNNNLFNSKTYSSFQNNMEYQIKTLGFILATVNEEPKIGLNNIGATCYMNATLQCLSHTLKLSNYFLNPKHENFINSEENILSKSYLEVLKKLWIKSYNNYQSNYSPNDFKNKISEMDPLFQGIQANDSKDLINFILQQLHLELNKNKYHNNVHNNTIIINQNDEQNVLRYFLEDYKKNHCSIISDLFYGIIETKTECLLCKQRNQFNGIFNPFYSFNFQIISFIIFPLEEIRKIKYEIYNCNEVNLNDCFDYYEKEEIMQGDNSMWCKYCGQNTSSKYRTLIYSSPEYFILILNRGKGNIYNVKLHFQEIIDISKYVQMKGSQTLIYQLYAIVTHLGPSSMSGHFISFCKSPIDNMWYKYNDSLVDCIGKSFNDIHEFGCPYILFYERQGI